MKKVFSVLVITILLISMTSITALAHGGHKMGNKSALQARHRICTADSCEATGLHQHDKLWYCNQACEQSDYKICSVKDCTQLGLHEHNGVIYHCSSSDTGCKITCNR